VFLIGFIMPDNVEEPAVAYNAVAIKRQLIPSSLVKEQLDGINLYYRGYREVLEQSKKLEDIMGCSSEQWAVLEYFVRLLGKITDEDRYALATNEAGVHLKKNSNLSVDAAVFDWKIFTPDMVSKKYASVAPILTIEIDIDIELSPEETSMTIPEYVERKVNRLIEFGVQRVIWVFTATKNILVAEPGKLPVRYNWDEDILLWEEHTINIGAYLRKKNIAI
jgi:hypothetical protein